MEKCKEMLIDFRRKKTEIPLINIGDDKTSRVNISQVVVVGVRNGGGC